MPVARRGWRRTGPRPAAASRAGVRALAAVIAIAAFGIGGCGPASTTATPSGAVQTPQTASATPSATPSLAAATPSQSPADADDEAVDTSSPGASITPGPTGAPVASPASGSTSDRLPGEPDPALTPGALNPAVTQATIGSTICVSGWTATIRPPSSYTTGLKIEQIAAYGYANTSTSAYEEDHLISLELGGAPTDAHNLWPEPYAISLPDGRPTGAHTKDGFETKLKNEVCSGAITLALAQAEIGDYWVHAYYGIPLVSGTPNAGPSSLAPTASPGPIAAGSAPAASLSVKITSLPASVAPGSKATLTAVTAPGATCSARVEYASGTVSAAAGLKPQPVAGSSGGVSWTWTVGTSTGAGTSTATVTCSLGGATASIAGTFRVT